MAQAKIGDIVKVHYTGKLDDGTVFDTSLGREPLEFKIGEGEIIPGFENAVIGMSPGETKTVRVPAEEAFGPYYEEMVLEIERDQLPPDLEPYVGQQLQVRQADGEILIVRVTEVTDTKVKLDANHPLAGKDLIFDIQLLEILEA